MPVEIETHSALDSVLLDNVPLPLHATFFPLGFPLEIATNSREVLSAARQSWGVFQASYPEAPVSLFLAVTEDEDERLPPRPKFRTNLHLMSIVSDARNQVICDFNNRCASGWVTRPVAADAGVFRLRFLDASAMTMLVTAHLAPLHSALVTRHWIGIALCGDSFAGKSTLACRRSSHYKYRYASSVRNSVSSLPTIICSNSCAASGNLPAS